MSRSRAIGARLARGVWSVGGAWGVLVVAVVAGMGTGAQVARAEPPRVVLTMPGMAEEAVDPATTQIRVEFSQDMSRDGYSICGGGPEFPELDGKPRWEAPRVLLIPVKLAPNHRYSMSFNCGAATNFRSVAGETLEIMPLSFKTGEPGAKPAELTPEQLDHALDTLEAALAGAYAYREHHHADAAAIRASISGQLQADPTRATLARAIAKALTPLGDRHIWINCGEFTLGTARGSGRVNFALGGLKAALGSEPTRMSNAVLTATLSDGVRYVLIGGWDAKDPATLEPARAFIGAMPADCPGLIVDVRPNGGGDELAARSIAALLTSERTVYARNQNVDPASEGGFTTVFDRVLEPAATRPPAPAKIAVLIGPACMSSNESFIQMMRYGAKARLFGERTAGSSGNPKPHVLSDGLTVMLPSWRDMEPDGRLVEGQGIEPDVVVEWAAKGDPVVDSALAWIRGK